MKALVFNGPNAMGLQEVAVPALGEGDLLVQVKACLICGTDIRIYRGRKTKDVRVPSILGHEFSGVISQTGGQLKDFKAGDAISLAPVLPCRSCYNCTHGQENVCSHRTACGYEYNGAFAEYIRIPAAAVQSGNVFPVEPTIPFEVIALAEPIACCLNGQGNSPIHLGDTVVIMGAGPIGLIHLLLAKISGAKVIMSEPNCQRRQMALQLGADVAVDPAKEDLQEAVLSHSHGVGADVVILAIGVPGLVNQSLDLVRKRGAVNLFAGFSVGDMPPVDVNKIHYKEIRLTGTSASSRKDHELALRLLHNRRNEFARLISHRFPLDQGMEAIHLAEAGGGVKVAIMP